MSFGEFIRKNGLKALLFGLIVEMIYSPVVCTNNYCADLEYVAGAKGSIYNWNELGRYTLLLIKKLCFTPYNPVLESILFVIISFAAVTSLAYLFYLTAENLESLVCFILSAAALVFPTFAEQYYFKFQSAEVFFGILLLIFSGILLIKFLKDKKPLLFVFSILLCVLSFGIYQSMLNIIMIIYAGTFTVFALEKRFKDTVKDAIWYVLHFFASFLINKIITTIFCESGSYFSDKIMWKTYPFATCFHFIKYYFRVVLLAEKATYSFSFIISVVLSLIALLILSIKTKNKALTVLLGIFGLIILPFCIAIIQGFEPDSRTQLALPFSVAYLILFSIKVFTKYLSMFKENTEGEENAKSQRNFKTAAIFISFFILLLNLVPTARLVYSRSVINKADNLRIEKIASDLENYNCSAFSDDSSPVIFIGKLEGESNSLSVKPDEKNRDYILISVFSLDADTEPKFFFSSNRILGAMENAGYSFKKPSTSEFVKEAESEAKSLPSFPDDGYIKEFDNYVLVNLSNTSE